MKYLAVNKFKVIALRDLAKYEKTQTTPQDALQIIKTRKQGLQKDIE